MQDNLTKTKVIYSLTWKIAERLGAQGIQFAIQLILARLLLPSEYGLIAIVMVFIVLANVFVQSGFNTALIQKKDVDEVDYSSVLYLSLVVATTLYLFIYFIAPLLADFYMRPMLEPVLRVLSITLFIGAFNSIQNAYIAKNMLFKKLFISSLGAVIISGIIGITSAYLGWGVWALVLQQLINQLTVAIILWFTVKWRPRLLFSLMRIKSLFGYGSKILMSSIIDTLYRELNTLLVGKLYNPEILGYYNRGQQFPQLIVSNIDGSIQSVLLPALSAHQDNKLSVKNMMRRAIMTSSFLIFPMMVGMAVVAEPIVKIVLTDKWLMAVPFLQIFCFSFALWPVHTANLQAINAMGRSDVFLKLEILKKIIGLIILGICIPFGIYAIAIGQVLNSVISTFINAYPNNELLDYSFKEQFVDIVPSLLISALMGSVVFLLSFLSVSILLLLMIQFLTGIIVYIGLAKLFKLESFNYIFVIIKQVLKIKS